MFEQRDRWLEELSAHVGREESVVGSSGRMNLVAIAAEIVNADADERRQQRIHVPNWESMAVDLRDTTEYLGLEALSVVQEASAALIDAIDNLFVEQLDERGQARRGIDNERRPRVKASAAELFELLNGDTMMIAMWRDLIAACQNANHVDHSYDRLGFLRDNVVAPQEHRRQDPGHWGLLKTAVEILFDFGVVFSARKCTSVIRRSGSIRANKTSRLGSAVLCGSHSTVCCPSLTAPMRVVYGARECLSENRIRDGPSLIRVGAISLHVATHPIGMLGLVAVT